jgi:uncharacterized protein YybS (DUF2232 family)
MNVSVTAGAREGQEPRPWGPLAAALFAAAVFTVCLRYPLLLGLAAVSSTPIAIQRLRGTAPAFVATAGAAALIGAAFSSFEIALLFVLAAAVPALLLGEAMARGRGLRRGCLWAFIALSLQISGLLLVDGPGMARLATSAAADLQSQPAGQLMLADQVEQWNERAKILESALAIVYPAAWLILGGLMITLHAAVVRTYLARRDPAWLDGGEFEGIRMPFGLAIVFVMAGAGVLVPPVRPLAYNVLLLVTFFLVLQGMAIVLYYANRLNGPPFLRKLVVVLVLVNYAWASQLLALLGLFDLWFDIRRYADVQEQPK